MKPPAGGGIVRRPPDPQRPQEPPDRAPRRAGPHLRAGGAQPDGQPHPAPPRLLHEAAQGHRHLALPEPEQAPHPAQPGMQFNALKDVAKIQWRAWGH